MAAQMIHLNLESCHARVLYWAVEKLDGVGPFDNRPSTDKLQHFVKKEEEEKERNYMQI